MGPCASARPGLVAACVLVVGLGAATLLWDNSLVTILTLHAGRRGHSQGRGADDDEGVWAGVKPSGSAHSELGLPAVPGHDDPGSAHGKEVAPRPVASEVPSSDTGLTGARVQRVRTQAGPVVRSSAYVPRPCGECPRLAPRSRRVANLQPPNTPSARPPTCLPAPTRPPNLACRSM